MKKKANRLDAIKMIISSKDVSSQEELLQALSKEGFELTQATLSRDLKQLKVAKAANMNGKYVYVLPNNIMYKRSNDQSASEMLMTSGFVSLQFRAILPSSVPGPDMPAAWPTTSTTESVPPFWVPLPEMTPSCWWCTKQRHMTRYAASYRKSSRTLMIDNNKKQEIK